jgi:hypothetical protein
MYVRLLLAETSYQRQVVKEIVLRLQQQTESGTGMVVFMWRTVVVAKCQGVLSGDQEVVSDSQMAIVMHCL